MSLLLLLNPKPPEAAELKADSGALGVEGYAASMEVSQLWFSEFGIAERFAADPMFYRNLAAFVASELRRQAGNADGHSNSGLIIKGQLTELAEGFDSIAAVLTADDGILTPIALKRAAGIVIKVRQAYVTFAETYAGLIDLAVIGFAGYVLHQFGGFDPNLSLLISSAIVKNEKLADVIGSWVGKK